MKTTLLLLLAASLLPLSPQARAGAEIKEYKAPVETPFDKGKIELQIGIGAFTSFQASTVERPRITDLDAALRLGVMLYTPEGDGIFRGNLEFLGQIYGAGVVEGPGSFYGGATLMLRYNFVQPGARWVPYFQIFAGGVYNDIYEDAQQRVFGQAFEYELGTGLGLRYLCSDACAFFVEIDWRHISNGGGADRNLGLNSLGGFVGVSYFY